MQFVIQAINKVEMAAAQISKFDLFCACASAYSILSDQVGAGLLEFKTCS